MRNCSKNRRNGIRNTLKFLLDYMRAAPACSIAASAVDLVIALLPSAISVATAMVTDSFMASRRPFFARSTLPAPRFWEAKEAIDALMAPRARRRCLSCSRSTRGCII